MSSAIVGGNIPISLGLAISIKKNKQKSKVHCFIGDMTAESGLAYEAIKYSRNHKLPIRFVIEDNDLSVCTETKKVWNIKKSTFSSNKFKNDKMIYYYKYKNKYPHAGAGKRVQF